MLISQKVTQDKRIVTDFRHLNDRIVKKNLAYPLVRDMFLVLRNPKCEVLLVLDFVFWECLIFISKNAYGIKHLSFHLAIIHKCNFRMFTK